MKYNFQPLAGRFASDTFFSNKDALNCGGVVASLPLNFHSRLIFDGSKGLSCLHEIRTKKQHRRKTVMCIFIDGRRVVR